MANGGVVLVTLASAGERSHFFVVPRNHVTAGLLACKGYLDGEGKAWPQIIFGDVEFPGYNEAWDLLDRLGREARWGMAEWVAEAGRVDRAGRCGCVGPPTAVARQRAAVRALRRRETAASRMGPDSRGAQCGPCPAEQATVGRILVE
jgi:hypothetical protein